MTCLIYCLEPEQNVEQNRETYPRGVIKIGIQETKNDNRIESYGKKSIIHFCVLCEDPRRIENVMKSVFLENDIKLTKGTEYFYDDIDKIKNLFKETLKENLLEKDLNLFLIIEKLEKITKEDNRIFYHLPKIFRVDDFTNKDKLKQRKVEQERRKLDRKNEEVWKENMDTCLKQIKEIKKKENLSCPLRFMKQMQKNFKMFDEYDKKEFGEDISVDKYPAKLLYNKYVSWCDENDGKKMSQTAFGKIITTKYEKTKCGRIFYNLK